MYLLPADSSNSYAPQLVAPLASVSLTGTISTAGYTDTFNDFSSLGSVGTYSLAANTGYALVFTGSSISGATVSMANTGTQTHVGATAPYAGRYYTNNGAPPSVSLYYYVTSNTRAGVSVVVA